MCSTNSEFGSFTARLRGLIRASTALPERGWPQPQVGRTQEQHPTAAAGASRAPAMRPGFNALALELFALQFQHNPPYRRLCEAREATPANVDDWTEIPAVPTSAFKELDLTCLPARERTAVFHSSGTTEHRPSRHYHSADSLALYDDSVLAGFGANCHAAIANSRLAILTPPPAQAPHSSLVHMFEVIRRRYGAGTSAFLGAVDEEGSWTLQLDAAVGVLREANAAGQPLLLLGTAFSYVHLLDHLADLKLRLQLAAGSCALETGGYKGRSRSLPREALHALITQRLGVPSAGILSEYGMSELSSQAYDSAPASSRITYHASLPFRFPPWARVQIVSPETGLAVGDGEPGLIRVFDLANVYSVMAIQTEDLGVRHGDGFALLGRATLAEPRGCSLMAV